MLKIFLHKNVIMSNKLFPQIRRISTGAVSLDPVLQQACQTFIRVVGHVPYGPFLLNVSYPFRLHVYRLTVTSGAGGDAGGLTAV